MEDKYSSQKRYMREHTKLFSFRVSVDTEEGKELIKFLESCGNKQKTIREAVQHLMQEKK